MSKLTKVQRRVYDLFVADPDGCRASYLYDAYKRGRLGIMQPDKTTPSYAAWLAGHALSQGAPNVG